MIEVAHVSKSFKIYKNTKDSKHKLRSLFAREYEIKRAVDDVSFTVGDGEPGELTMAIRNQLLGIQLGEIADPHDWMWKVC